MIGSPYGVITPCPFHPGDSHVNRVIHTAYCRSGCEALTTSHVLTAVQQSPIRESRRPHPDHSPGTWPAAPSNSVNPWPGPPPGN